MRIFAVTSRYLLDTARAGQAPGAVSTVCSGAIRSHHAVDSMCGIPVTRPKLEARADRSCVLPWPSSHRIADVPDGRARALRGFDGPSQANYHLFRIMPTL